MKAHSKTPTCLGSGGARHVRLHDALQYHDRGLAVIPANSQKIPAVAWKRYQNERPSESQVRQWFGDDDRPAIAAVMGDVSGGLVCRDFDDMAAYDRWAAEYPRLAKHLPTAVTPRPGRHVYFRADPQNVREASGRGLIAKFDDGELRGGQCICLLPPSAGLKGHYSWSIPLPHQIPEIDLPSSGLVPSLQHRGHREHKDMSVSSTFSMLHDLQLSESVNINVKAAIIDTLPDQYGRRHRCLFELARQLKAIPELADAELSDLKPIVRGWHGSALPRISTKPFDQSWADFAEAWSKVIFPKGKEPIRMIMEKAIQSGVPDEAREYDTPEIVLLVRLCRELQRHHGSDPFFLDCRTAAKLLRVGDHTTAWRWLRLLQHDKVLEKVSSGSQSSHKANQYRYLGEL